jgi:hypothetical protein
VVAKGENLLEDWPASFVESNAASTPFDEVKEIISIPEYNDAIGSVNEQPHHVISKMVYKQLRSFVARIASLYNDNYFHSFEHASHVGTFLGF